MKKTIILVIVCIFINSNIYSNYVEYFKVIIKAQDLILDNNLDSALYFYKKAFSIVNKPFPKDLSNAAIVAYKLDSTELMKKYVRLAIINASDTRLYKIKFRNKIKSHNYWKSIKKQLSEKYEIRKKDSLYNVLNEMFQNDQKARNSLFNKKNKMYYVDSINRIKISKILSNNKFPGYITVGAEKTLIITVIFFLHFPIENYENYLVYAIKNGELSPQWAFYAYVRQYKYKINKNSCPLHYPLIFKETFKIYKGKEYENLTNQGFDFNYHL